MTTTYLTPSEASEYIGRQFPDGSGILDDAVSAVSRMIDRHCGRHFYQVGTADVPVSRYFEVEDFYELELGTYNDLVSVDELNVDADGDGVYETEITAAHYVLCPVGAATKAPTAEPFTEIELLNGTTFPMVTVRGREYLIEVSGIWGWPSVPIEVKQAARILVAELAKLQDAPLGVAGQSEFGVFRVSSQMPPRAQQLLAPFVHPQHVGIA